MDTTTLEALWTLGIIIFFLLCVTTYLFYAMTSKDELLKNKKEEHEKLMRSFNELDDQARLIVRTDLELNKTREEMDKRLTGLNALQRISRQMSQALNENEVFQRISPELFEDLGFARVMIASMDNDNALKIRVNVGYKSPRTEALLKEVSAEEPIRTAVNSLSSINCPAKTKEHITRIFEIEHFIISPILTQRGNVGFVFVGNRYNAPPVSQGDEELLTIFAGQIGQSIENAQLFEKAFHSSQELELKVAERTKQLESALEKVNEISNKKTEFISAVSHELRTPLTSIKGYAAILIAGKIGEVPPAVKERLAKINSHSDNLVALINDLLDIARIESGKQEMKLAMYKVKSIVDNVADLLTPQINTKGVHLKTNLGQACEEVYVDSSHAERVIINLVSNAIKFTPANGTITISIAPALDNGYAVFSVADTGIGIPASDMQKLFSEFFRVDNEINQHVKGTGLGLVLAKNITLAHRGKMWVQSQVGVGTTFFFTLPASAKAYEDHLKSEIVIPDAQRS